MTHVPSPAAYERARATPEEVRLLRQEAATIASLVAAGQLTAAAGRRAVVRLARRLGKGGR